MKVQENHVSTPAFSIIIPIFNAPAAPFEACMDSILNQGFGNFEVILSDDGSSPECARRCDHYAESDSRVRVLHHPNQGVSAARNHGIEAATGQSVMFVDADDWLERDACGRLATWLEDHPCDILMFNAVREYPDGPKAMNYGFEHAHLYCTDDVEVREMLFRRVVGVPYTKQGRLGTAYYVWDKVFSRRFLMENNLRFPVGVPKSEDKVFVCSCFEKMRTLFYVEDVLYHYRMVASSACHKYSENADKDRMLLAEKMKVIVGRMDRELGRLKSDPDYHEMDKALDRFIFGLISDVFFLKYYHRDYPGNDRRKEALALLSREPFRSALRNVPYGELTPNAKLKKFLLSHGFIGLFWLLKKRTRRVLP